MQVDVWNNEAGGVSMISISDDLEVLTMRVVRNEFGVSGLLRDQHGRTWEHASVAEINLLILHARREFETVRELLEDLGPCDEDRLAALRGAISRMQKRNSGE